MLFRQKDVDREKLLKEAGFLYRLYILQLWEQSLFLRLPGHRLYRLTAGKYLCMFLTISAI